MSPELKHTSIKFSGSHSSAHALLHLKNAYQLLKATQVSPPHAAHQNISHQVFL